MNRYKVRYRLEGIAEAIEEYIDAVDAGHAFQLIINEHGPSTEILEVTPEDAVTYECEEPFFIDNGELEGVTPQQAFVLGVEWQMVYHQTNYRSGFDRMIHAENRARVMQLLARNKRKYECGKPKDGWCSLLVHEQANLPE